jgi:hypothetical protein
MSLTMSDVNQKELLTPVENVTPAPSLEVVNQPVVNFSPELQQQIAADENAKREAVSAEIEQFNRAQNTINQEKSQPVIVDESTLSPDKVYATRPIITTELTQEEWREKQKAPPTESVCWLITSIKKALRGTGGELVFKQAA